MSEPDSTDLIATPAELTDADLEQVAGGTRAIADVLHASANVQHVTANVHDLNITKKIDQPS